MIKRIEIIYRKRSVWARGSTYDSVGLVPLKDGQVLFAKNYKKDTPVFDVWDEIRGKMTDFFFEIFYPAVISQTISPEPPTSVPEVALTRQTKYIRQRQSKLPEYYMWDATYGKWHMSMEGYLSRTEDLGGPMDISVAESPLDRMYDSSLLDRMQERYSGQTRTIVLFVYPDKYDEEVRALFELRITFW